MFENPRRGRQARNFTTNVPKILDLKSYSEQIFFRKLSLGAPEIFTHIPYNRRDKYARFHAQFQLDLHSFDQNIPSFENSLF